jgi:hypothetical protein
MKIRPIVLPLLGCALLAACVAPQNRQSEALDDPLPALFPVRIDFPRNIVGFELREDYGALDPLAARTLIYVGPAPQRARVSVDIRFNGAYVDGFDALRQQWPDFGIGIDELLRSTQSSVQATRSDRRRSIRAADGGPERQGRALRLVVIDAQGQSKLAAYDLYFVDPYMVSVHSESSMPDSAAAESGDARQLDDFAGALIAALKPSSAVLCDPRVQVLKLRYGLSNVSSNGRVIFISTQTDHVDASTVAELKRAAALQRERVGCTGQAQDFGDVEAQMRRRARVR